MIGRTISHYKIVEKLGEGGMGVVYKAEDIKLHRPVALKVLPRQALITEEDKTRFAREAQAAASLSHPNVAMIHEFDEVDDPVTGGKLAFIAMEYVDGETVKQKIKERPLRIDETLKIAIATAEGLAEAHGKGIIHRDIKSENIMISRSGVVKIMDFGLAEIAGRSRVTKEGMTVGTTAYMSPEQALGEKLDQRTDIWSLGVVLYEMTTGRLPFAGDYEQAIVYRVLNEEPEPITSLRSNVPMELERIVKKAMRKDQSERYQSVNEVTVDLKSLRKESDKVETAIRPTKAQRLHKGRAYVGIAVLVISLILAILYLFTSHGRPIDSMAVMPFVNASGNADVEYLSDGMTESLITSLSQVPKLSVKARSSVFRYKGKDAPPQQVGKELNVQAILNGRLVQRGNDLTLHIELVDVNTETALWSGDYNRSMTNFVSLPSEIARDVSSKLRLKLSSPDEQKLAKNYPADPEAYRLYLNGRYHLSKLILSESEKGVSYFQQAIAMDPSYALAYVGLADGYRSYSLSTGELPSTEFLPKAKAAAQKAIDIDDALAEAHASLGNIIFWYDWDWNAAEKQCKRALELNPNSSDAHLVYANLLSFTGRHTEALAEAKRARELDPFNLRINALEGQYLIHAGQVDEALARFQKTFELDPNFWFAHLFAASAYIEKGMFVEAAAEARKARVRPGVSSHPTSFLGYALAKSGKQADARTELGALLKLSNERYVPPYYIALIHNGLGERNEALTWLERGFKQRDARMVMLKVEPKWNNLRADPRFKDLLRRMNFSTNENR